MAKKKRAQLPIGAQIRAAREAAGIAAEDAAHELGVRMNTWYRWERSERTPRDLLDRLPQIAKMLGAEYHPPRIVPRARK